jgi:hypothetical protein
LISAFNINLKTMIFAIVNELLGPGVASGQNLSGNSKTHNGHFILGKSTSLIGADVSGATHSLGRWGFLD